MSRAVSRHLPLPALATAILLAFASLAPAPARAAIDTVDPAPAATLLLPYFEVDLANPNGPSTVLQFGNASGNATLTHVTLWTDLGVPTYAFDVYLGGYDVVELDLALLFQGIVPQTSPTIGAPGAFSGPHVIFPNCLTLLAQGRIPAATVAALQAAHTGQASPLLGGDCGGTAATDQIARGYVTIDVVNQCSTVFPGAPAGASTPAYFVAGGAGIASNANVLWGHYQRIQRSENAAWSERLVSIEASSTDPRTSTPGQYTFYGRRIAFSAADNREGLPSSFNPRFLNGGALDQGTSLQVWRDTGLVAAFPCGGSYPLLPNPAVGVFDERERMYALSTPTPPSQYQVFPLAAQSLSLSDTSRVTIAPAFGFLYLNLSLGPVFNQAWVTVVHRAAGRFAAGHDAGALNSPASPFYYDAGSENEAPQVPQCNDGLDNDGNSLVDYPADPACVSPSDPIEGTAFQCSDGVDNEGDGLVDFPADPSCMDDFDPNETTACSDGVDNDGDGFTDFPADPGCANGGQLAENPACDDGVDNDGDGAIDFPADIGCTSRSDPSEVSPACSDGIDNDGDGLVDFGAGPTNDPGCASPTSNLENPQCSDGISNDADGLVDFPADPGCASPSGSTESPACSDGFDNDGDTLIDFPADPGCLSASGTNERRPCNDGVDNDSDGLVDFPNDPNCIHEFDLSELPECMDGFDNDLDVFIDFPADPQCGSPTAVSEATGQLTFACHDGLDNDNDGLTDFPADPSCHSAGDDDEALPLPY